MCATNLIAARSATNFQGTSARTEDRLKPYLPALPSPLRGEGRGEQELGGSAVEPVPVGLALDAARRGRLILQPSLWDTTAAAFADPVRALAQALERPFDLLPVLVEQVDEEVARLPVGQGLGQVGLFRDPGDHAADHVVQRPVQPRLLAALGGQELESLPVSLQPLLWSVVCLFPNRHC